MFHVATSCNSTLTPYSNIFVFANTKVYFFKTALNEPEISSSSQKAALGSCSFELESFRCSFPIFFLKKSALWL